MNAVPDPDTEMLRWQPMLDWLKKRGLSKYEVRQLIDNRIIKGKPIRPGGRDWYYVSQIKRDVFGENGTENSKVESRK